MAHNPHNTSDADRDKMLNLSSQADLVQKSYLSFGHVLIIFCFEMDMHGYLVYLLSFSSLPCMVMH